MDMEHTENYVYTKWKRTKKLNVVISRFYE